MVFTAAKFDFEDEMAYDYTITVSGDSTTTFLEKLGTESADYDTVAQFNVETYTFAKIDLDTMEGNIANRSVAGNDYSAMTENDLKTLYNDVYNQVKADVKDREALAIENDVEFNSYIDLLQYTRNQCSCFVGATGIVRTTLNYNGVKAIIETLKTELTDAKYSDSKYNQMKERINSAYTYLIDLQNKENISRFNEDGGLAITFYGEVEGIGLCYRVFYETTEREDWSAIVHCENNVVYNDYLEITAN